MSNNAGRPTTYRGEYCQELIKHMENGNSFESFAAVINVVPSTIYLWVQTQQAFSEAYQLGQAKSLLFWENLGIKACSKGTEGFPQATFGIYMRNRFKWDKDYAPKPLATTKEEREVIDGRSIQDRARELRDVLDELAEPNPRIIPIESMEVQSKPKDVGPEDNLETVPLAKANSV